VSLEVQVQTAMLQIQGVQEASSPTNQDEADQLALLASYWYLLDGYLTDPPLIASIYSLHPLVGAANVACPGTNCLDLIDSPASLTKQQCLTGVVGLANECEEWLGQVTSTLANAAHLLDQMGHSSAAEVVDSAAGSAENIGKQSLGVTRPTLPSWVWLLIPAAIAGAYLKGFFTERKK